MRGWRLDAKKLTNIMDMSKDLQIILTDMHRNLQIIPARNPRNLQIILRFSLKFSDFLLNYPIFSDFLRFSPIFSDFLLNYPIFSPYPVFSSYLCTRKSAALKKGLRCYNLYKVLKNDEALPSEIDSRAFFSLWTSDGIAGNGGQEGTRLIQHSTFNIC